MRYKSAITLLLLSLFAIPVVIFAAFPIHALKHCDRNITGEQAEKHKLFDYHPPKAENGAAIGALVFGIIGIPASVFLWTGILAGIWAISAGIVGLRGNKRNKGLAIAGLILGLIDIGLSLIFIINGIPF